MHTLAWQGRASYATEVAAAQRKPGWRGLTATAVRVFANHATMPVRPTVWVFAGGPAVPVASCAKSG